MSGILQKKEHTAEGKAQTSSGDILFFTQKLISARHFGISAQHFCQNQWKKRMQNSRQIFFCPNRMSRFQRYHVLIQLPPKL